MRGRPGRVVVGAVGLAAVGVLALVGTFLAWYQIRGETSIRSVSGWSMLVDHGVSFEAPIEPTDARGPTGAVTLVCGLMLLGAAYAAWWLAAPDTNATPLVRQEVRAIAAIACVAGGLGLVLPLGVAVGGEASHAFVSSTPRTLCLAGLLAMSVFLALALVPRHNS